MKFEIEKNIPIPPKKVGKPKKYGIVDKMEIGDSILVPTRNQAIGCNNRARTIGYKMTIRKAHGVLATPNAYRIWRVK